MAGYDEFEGAGVFYLPGSMLPGGRWWELDDAHRQLRGRELLVEGGKIASDDADEKGKRKCLNGGNGKMKYDEEIEKLDKGGETWKPEAGQYKVENLVRVKQ
jgi:hypothetical protein